MKKIITLFLVSAIFVEVALFSGCNTLNTKKIIINDFNGSEFVSFSNISESSSEIQSSENRAYIETALSESASIISEQRNCSIEKARKYLLDNQCVIYTYFDKKSFDAIKNAYKNFEASNLGFGCAITDLQGNLLAIYSAGTSENGSDYVNFATQKTSPYSSFKPLCVYTPAIENGLVNWSTVYEDSPFKKIENEYGQMFDWPANSTNTYSYKNKTVASAVKVSLNTVAVKCMETVGVTNSLDFLEQRFGLTLEFEKNKTETYGEEETIGNVALGHLYEGVSPVDMAGYYQVYANGGIYTKPHTVLKICNKEGETIYEYESDSKQVIKGTTYYIMNQLLQNVVTIGGTGEQAHRDGILIGGKTGTGDLGNWFVGFTPQYTCAVWHDTQIVKNNASEIFGNVISGLDNDENIDFSTCNGIKKALYCTESGKLFSEKCKNVDVGYFALDNLPEICDAHN